MRKILLALPLVVLASTNTHAEEVLFCNEIEGTGIFFDPEGVVTAGVKNSRFKASINRNSFTVKGYDAATDGTYSCKTPYQSAPHMLLCNQYFQSIAYNTKTNHGSLAAQFVSDAAPKSGSDSLTVSLFKCDTF